MNRFNPNKFITNIRRINTNNIITAPNFKNKDLIQTIINKIKDAEKQSNIISKPNSYLLSKSYLNKLKEHCECYLKGKCYLNDIISQGVISNKEIYENSFGWYTFLKEDSFLEIEQKLFEIISELLEIDEIITSSELIYVVINDKINILIIKKYLI